MFALGPASWAALSSGIVQDHITISGKCRLFSPSVLEPVIVNVIGTTTLDPLADVIAETLPTASASGQVGKLELA